MNRWVIFSIVDLSLLKNRVFASANVTLVLGFLALFAVSFLMPFYFEQLRHFSTWEAGLLLTPLPLTIVVVAPLSGMLADRLGTRWLAATGLAISCLGLVLISGLKTGRVATHFCGRLPRRLSGVRRHRRVRHLHGAHEGRGKSKVDS